MNNVWNLQKSAMDGNTNSIVSVLTTYSANFSSAATSVNSALAGIKSSVDAIIAQANAKAAASVQKVQTQTSAVTTAATKAASTAVANTKTQAKVATTTKKPVVITTTKKVTTTTKKLVSLEEWLRMDANAKYRYIQSLSESDQKRLVSELRSTQPNSMFGRILGGFGVTGGDRLTLQQAQGAANEAEAFIQRLKLLSSGKIKYAPVTSGIMSFLGFASGAKRVGSNTLAWTNENWDKNGGETILRASDHAVLQPVGTNDRIYNAMASSNLWNMANNPSRFIAQNISPNIGSPLGSPSSGNNSVNLENVNFNFPSVKNYTEFVTALQNDKKFEAMIQNMTLGAMMGRNNKSNILWNH
jgi:F0F1-type ATP synthase membrane subunit b/b'